MSIPRWIRRREPKLVPFGPAVWQLPLTVQCWPLNPPKCPSLCLGGGGGNLFGLYPFPDGSADVCQIWCQSVHPFDCFPRLLNLWHPNPPPVMPPGVLRGDLYLAYVHYQMNPQTWIKVGANRTASKYFWNVDPPRTPKCPPPCVSKGNLFGVYPFPYELPHVCQIWFQSDQPFGSFSRFCLRLVRLFAAVRAGSRNNHRLKTQTDNVNDGNEISLVSGIVGWQH